MILNKKQIISSTISSTDCNLSKIGSFQIIQDAITEMCGLNKIDGVSLKQKFNAFWVFTKTRAKFYKQIPWYTVVSITCYISAVSAIRMNADVEVRDKSGNLALHSRTEMCALDISSQRIQKLSKIGVDENLVEHHPTEEITFTKFNETDLQTIDRVQVKSTNIDFSHHTNNLEYVRLILNTYSVAELEEKFIKEMEILYVSQSFEKDILEIKKSTTENADIFVIEKETKPIVKCEILY